MKKYFFLYFYKKYKKNDKKAENRFSTPNFFFGLFLYKYI